MSATVYTYFGCFRECTADLPPPGRHVRCPGCGAVLATGEAPPEPAPSDFGVTDEDRRALTAGRVDEAYAAEAESDAMLKSFLKNI